LYNIPRITEDIFSKFGFNQFINLRFTDKYDIELTANALSSSDIKVSIDALSGGQRIALSIALRLAIAKILNEKTDFLILDEPTIHLDESRKKELVDLLGDLKESNFIRQLIVVTHDDEIKERADVIYKVSYGSVVNVEAVS
ncbi:MAG: SbcC/MukB-like Walker B domain-containing protein, partial [Sulfurihydrogenibium sp.]